MTINTAPTRKAVPKNFSIDEDALVLLSELCPSRKAHGRFLSELVRREKALREERARLRKVLATALEASE